MMDLHTLTNFELIGVPNLFKTFQGAFFFRSLPCTFSRRNFSYFYECSSTTLISDFVGSNVCIYFPLLGGTSQNTLTPSGLVIIKQFARITD